MPSFSRTELCFQGTLYQSDFPWSIWFRFATVFSELSWWSVDIHHEAVELIRVRYLLMNHFATPRTKSVPNLIKNDQFYSTVSPEVQPEVCVESILVVQIEMEIAQFRPSVFCCCDEISELTCLVSLFPLQPALCASVKWYQTFSQNVKVVREMVVFNSINMYLASIKKANTPCVVPWH